jgi:sulfatase maturation enzyme AslB (radical SAM superfamily)
MTERKNFCVAPWISLHIWPNNNVYPCCMSDSTQPFGKLEDGVMNNDKFKQFRIEILQDNRADVCKNCFAIEDAGQQSMRQSLNNQYLSQVEDIIESTTEDGTADTKLLHWDFRSSNLCNFACRTCGPELSSTYKQLSNKASNLKGEKVLHINSASRINLDKLIDENIDSVQTIYFAGGEPLMMDEHASILSKLLAHNRLDVCLHYSTNGSRLNYKDTNFLDVWNKFKEVTLVFSLDEIGKRAEYWRHGTNWVTVGLNVDKAVEYAKQNKNVRVWFSPTVSTFNISRLKDIHKYFREHGWLDTNHPEIIFNLLHTQEFYCVKNTSNEFKQFASSEVDDYIQYLSASSYEFDKWQIQKVEGIKSFLLESGSDLKSQLTSHTAMLDKQRKESIFEVAPELADLLIDKSIYDK